jgi:hypothetical protein
MEYDLSSAFLPRQDDLPSATPSNSRKTALPNPHSRGLPRRQGKGTGAERGTRTPTSRLSPADFKSAASASSAIPAWEYSFYIVATL